MSRVEGVPCRPLTPAGGFYWLDVSGLRFCRVAHLLFPYAPFHGPAGLAK